MSTWCRGTLPLASREPRVPTHFRGVATVVIKLFNIVQPDRSYLGQKDGQQVAVIRRMMRDLNVPGELVVGPTVREPDGLAMSSRNTYLTTEERAAAPVIYRALTEALDLYRAGQMDADMLRDTIQTTLESERLVASIDYVSIADPLTLAEAEGEVAEGAMASTAVQMGKPRLLDNVILTKSTGAGS